MLLAFFGEAEHGMYGKPHFCDDLAQLADSLGEPPPESRGLFFAVQALLYQHALIYFRVEDEGYSIKDYWQGAQMLYSSDWIPSVKAICAPGVAEPELLETIAPIRHHPLILSNQKDIWDYLTS